MVPNTDFASPVAGLAFFFFRFSPSLESERMNGRSSEVDLVLFTGYDK